MIDLRIFLSILSAGVLNNPLPFSLMKTEQIAKYPQLINILDAFNSGYPDRMVEKYKDRIFLSDGALGVMCNIAGFISGLAMVDIEKAAKYAEDFIKWMDYLCPFHCAAFNIGSRDVTVPARVARLDVDGTCMSFRISWWILLEDQQQQGERIEKFGLWDAKYQYQMNGGLIFHGAGETYSVKLSGTRMWGIHT